MVLVSGHLEDTFCGIGLDLGFEASGLETFGLSLGFGLAHRARMNLLSQLLCLLLLRIFLHSVQHMTLTRLF